MKKNLIYSLFLVIFVVFFSCEKDDNTGDSTLVPSNPVVTITVPTDTIKLTENDAVYEFNVSISQPQIVDLVFYISQADGTATEGSDYSILNANSKVTIPATFTTGVAKVKILKDAEIENLETLKLQIGDERTGNCKLTPAFVNFDISNLTVNDLAIGLSWEASTPTTDDTGKPIAPTKLADMRLLITDSPYTEIFDGADGASFEAYTLTGDSPDGEYLVVADFYDAMAAPVRDLNLTVSFEQLGVIDPFEYSFEKAINTGTVCAYNYYIIAKIVKSGTNYTISKVGEVPPLTGQWFGDDEGYDSQVVSKLDCDGNYLINGLNFEWIADFWGETIVDENYVVIEIDQANGTVNIPFQDYFTTDYKGVEYPYSIQGTGTIDLSGEYPVMTIEYLLDQDGFDVSGWCFENGYMATDHFTAEITLNPAGLKAAHVLVKNKPLQKPIR